MQRKIIFSLILIILTIPCSYLLAYSPTSDDSVKIIAIQGLTGTVFINKGSADGLKERQSLYLNLSSDRTAALTVTEVFSHTAKLLIRDKSDIQYLSEGGSVSIKDAALTLGKTTISGESRSIFTDYNRAGQSRNKSFYPPGRNARQEIDVKIKDTSLKNLNVEGFISGRVTDDKYIDQEQRSIEGLYLNIEEKEKRYRLNLGDFYGYFSNYTLSQSLKGVKGFYSMENDMGVFNVTSLWGTNKHRWNEFWRRLEGEAYTRYISGARLEQLWNSKNIKLGLNFVDNRDDRGSSSPTGNPATNDVISSDLSLKVADRIFVKTEAAQAVTELNTGPYSSIKTKSAQAYQVDSDIKLTKYDFLKSAFSTGYERAGQNFSSLSGILKTDREEYYTRLNCDTYDYLSWYFGLVHSRNNLKDGLARTTKYTAEEFGFDLRPLPTKREFEIALDLGRRLRASSDTTIKEQSDTARLALRNKYGPLSLWGGWTVSKHDDENTITNGRFSHVFDLGSRLNLDYRNFNISPHLYLQFENRKQDSTGLDNVFKNLNTGVSLRSAEFFQLDLNYVVSDTNDDILLQNLTRQRLELETQCFLDRAKTRDISFSYTLDGLQNKNSSRDYSENLIRLEFRQRF